MSYRIGQQVGSYRLVRVLGRGGFAEVYLGEHRHLKSHAALKMLHYSLNDKEAQSFLDEARTLASLKHRNIVRVLDYFVERATGTPVLVMEQAPGGTILKRHPRNSILSLAMTLDYVKQLAAALQYAHALSIIHRDVKPENILLGSDSTLLLSDFGLALFSPTPEQLSSQDAAGTCHYMAPEQFQGKPTFASDQYALGILTYEWLCGKRPFEGTGWQIAHHHLFIEPPPLREHYPELSAAVEQVVLKALAKKPEDRFESVQAFADALEWASQGDYTDDAEKTLPRIIRPPAAPSAPAKSDVQTLQPVFLSAASTDAEFAARLKADLQKQGVLFSNDQVGEALEEDEGMRQAIRAAQFVLVILSPDTRSSRPVKDHMRVANMYRRQILFVRMAGEEVGEMLPIPDTWGETTVIDVLDAREPSYAPALQKLIARLVQDTGSSTFPASLRAEAPHAPRNPYKGLRAFTQSEATDFFGRDALIDELVERLQAALVNEYSGNATSRLLTVLGPSGSGKSSVVMAGLLPRLQQGELFESKQWLYLDPFVPGTYPLESLVGVLAPHLPGENTDSIRKILAEDSARGLHLLASRLTGRSGANVLLVVDQFEELFAQHLPEQERQHFIDLLLTAVTRRGGPVIAILTLRADYYDRPMRYPQLSRLIEACHVSVLPMELRDLRAAIEEPAYQPDVQLTFEANLVGDLLFEAQGQAGALPLLEFTLDQLYQHREGHWLTLDAYQKIGGVKGALIQHAESTYALLPSEQHRSLARTLFLRLLDPGMTEQDTTRRRAAMRELSLADEQETRMLRTVVEAFVNSRLLTTSEAHGEVSIEVSHEALIREWERLTTWLREAREDFTLQKTLANDTVEWIRRNKPADLLYRGSRLTEMQDWASRNRPNRDETVFLQAAEAERVSQEEFVLAQKAREVTLQQRVISRQRWLISALSVFSVVVVVLGSIAWLFYMLADSAAQEATVEKNKAELNAQIAHSQTLAADAIASLAQNQLDRALLLSRAAYQTYPTYEARNSLFISLEKSSQLVTMLHAQESNDTPNPVLRIAFSPRDSALLVSASSDHIYVWNSANTKTRNSPTSIDPGAVTKEAGYIGGMALSPNGQTLALSNAFGVWLQHIQASSQSISLDGKEGGQPQGAQVPTPITFTADGKLVLSARCDTYGHFDQNGIPYCTATKISTYDVATQHRVGNSPIIMADADTAVFTSHGQVLTTISDTNTIQFWEVKTGKLLQEIRTGSTEAISRLAFSTDGNTLATVSNTSIRLWDVSTGNQRPGSPLVGHTNSITDITFSPDGSQLAASSLDNTVTVWDVASGKLFTTLTGNEQAKVSLAFSPDGTLLASGTQQGTILLWKPSSKSTLSQQIASIGKLTTVLFTADGKFLLVGKEDGKVLVYDAQTITLLRTLSTEKYPLLIPDTWSIKALGLGGGKLVVGRMDGTIVLWDSKTWQPLPQSFIYPPHYVSKVMLSTDGRVLAVTGNGDNILLWDVASGKSLRPIPSPRDEAGVPRPVDLSPDGGVLALGQCSTTTTKKLCIADQLQFWDVFTGKMRTHTAPKPGLAITNLAFSPDGRILACSNSNGIILWDTRRHKPQLTLPSRPPQSQGTSDYSVLLFSPDGNRLVFYSSPSTAFGFIIWTLTLPSAEPLVSGFNEEDFFGGNIAFSPDGQRMASVSIPISSPDRSILTLWDLSITSWQQRACAIANRNLMVDERNQFVQGGISIRDCPDVGTGLMPSASSPHP